MDGRHKRSEDVDHPMWELAKDFDAADWDKDVTTGIWSLRETDDPEEKRYQTEDGLYRTEQYMRDHPRIDADGNEIPFDPDDYTQLMPGGAFILKGTDAPLGFGAQQSALVIESAVADWKAITDKSITDPFQRALEDALREIGETETDLVKAFQDLAGTGGELETLKEDWELEMERLVGGMVEDPTKPGEFLTPDEALAAGVITEERYDALILEEEGTYITDISGEETEREEG